MLSLDCYTIAIQGEIRIPKGQVQVCGRKSPYHDMFIL